MRAIDQRLRHVNSRQNALVKELRKAFHSAEPTPDGYSAAEGVRILEEATRSGVRFKAVFFRESALDRAHKLLPQLAAQVDAVLLPDDVFDSAVLSNSPQGVAALLKLKTFDLGHVLLTPNPLFLGVAGLQDPGNLGTIIRSSEAFGATGVLAAEATVQPSSPKVIRASAGSVFRLPVIRVELVSALRQLRERGVALWATSSHKGEPLERVELTGPTAVFIGSEGAGISREVLAQMDGTLVIPQSPRVESLNAGIAASIILYEAARQRRSMNHDSGDRGTVA